MNQTLISKVFKFIAVGVISTLLNYTIFYILLFFFNANYLLASACGYISGTALGFLLNNFYTFGYYDAVISKIGGYCAVYLFSLGLSSLFLWLMVDSFHLDKQLMNVAAICISTVTNFLGLNYLIYNK